MTFLADGELRRRRVAQEAQFPEPSQQSREVLGAFQKRWKLRSGGPSSKLRTSSCCEHDSLIARDKPSDLLYACGWKPKPSAGVPREKTVAS